MADAAGHRVITVAGVGIDLQHLLQVWVAAWTCSVLLQQQQHRLGQQLQVVELCDVVGVLLQPTLLQVPVDMFLCLQDGFIELSEVGQVRLDNV